MAYMNIMKITDNHLKPFFFKRIRIILKPKYVLISLESLTPYDSLGLLKYALFVCY